MNDFFGYALLLSSISWCFQHTHLGSNIFYPNYRILKQKTWVWKTTLNWQKEFEMKMALKV